jgi:hypothetical protein
MSKLRTYRVLYAVTRAEWYEIKAPDEQTALQEAIYEGKLVETGHAIDFTERHAEVKLKT